MVFLHRRRAALFGERAPNIWAILFAGYPRRALRSTKTGQWAWRTTESETLPRGARLAPPKPRLPITTRRSYRRQQREQKDLRDAGRLQSYLRTGRFMITPALP
jgi:hypothetical protein